MDILNFKIEGVQPLLMNNPHTVSPFNDYAKAMKKITSKRSKTDEDYLALGRLEVESKLYWEYMDKTTGEGFIYVPGRWVAAAIAGKSFALAKIAKKDIRAAVFVNDEKMPLKYDRMELVKTKDDIVGNEYFTHSMILPQGQVRIHKNAPIFHKWSFEGSINFDDSTIDRSSLLHILDNVAAYGGFGDFRPTFGRGKFTEVKSLQSVA